MERLLTQVRSRSFLLLSPTRQLSSLKSSSFDLKSQALLNLVKQIDASRHNTSLAPLDVETTFDMNTRFPLPGRIGFHHETNSLAQLNINQYDTPVQEKRAKEPSINTGNELLTKLNNMNNLEIHSYDCSSELGSKLNSLFLNYDASSQPLTVITVAFKTESDMSKWSKQIETERNQLIDRFTNVAQDISTYLNSKQYWVDFIDPSNGKPYYGPPTSDALFETDERLQHFGINIVDLGCCRVIEHLQHGTHAFIGCIFTSASKTDPSVQNLLKEFSLN